MAEVLVLEGVAGPGIDRLEADFTVERAHALEAAERLDDVRALVVRNATRIDAGALERLPALTVVGRAGRGLDNIDVARAAAAGVAVTYAPRGEHGGDGRAHAGARAGTRAPHPRARRRGPRAERWSRRFGTELAGETWGVLGMGRIGRRVAALAGGIGMRVLGHDPALGDEDLVAAGAEPRTLTGLVEEARVVSLHVPLPRRRAGWSTRACWRGCAKTRCSSTPRAASSSTRRRCSPRWRRGARQARRSTCARPNRPAGTIRSRRSRRSC